MKKLSTLFLIGLLGACAQPPDLQPGALQSQAGTTAIFVNELHYDNDGGDVGEAVEIAGPAGASLTGYSLVLYNGSGGAVYNTKDLSGTLPDEGNGFGTLAFTYPANGLQNGSPDAVALVNGDTVVQFLSYEGTFTAVGGPADGLESVDIGVAEGSSTPVGFSLQLVGSGATYQDFTWSGPAAASFGTTNAGQTFTGTGNAPVVPDCATPVFVTAGEAASRTVSATDADGTVTSIALTNVDPATDGVTLTDVTPAVEVGGTATATLHADTLTESGYSVTLTFGNSDAEPQSADCTVVVNVVQQVKIHDVQGGDEMSPLADSVVSITGVVVGDFQADDGDAFGTDLGGFYLQEEDADADGNPATSEGVFVYAPDAADVSQGDLVTVVGKVVEFKDLTEVTDLVRLDVVGTAPLPTATAVTLPVTRGDTLERFEGMYVTFPQALVISEYFNFDRFGEIVLSLPVPEGQDRVYQPTSYLDPDTQRAAIDAAQDLINRSRITLDDGRASQNPDPARHPNGDVFDLTNRFRGGDVVQNTTGVLDERFGSYRVQPTTGADYVQKNPRPETPDAVGGSLRVASFNVLNYFLTLDDGRDTCSPDRDQECRGADDTKEFERQRAKIISALAALDADVFGLIELENTPGVEPLRDIVAGLNAATGADYTFVDTGTLGTDAIKVGIVYKPSAVTPKGDYAVLDSSVDSRFVDTKNRPALAQTFKEADGGVFTLVVNHFKSKGSGCGAGDDSPVQGNCTLTRERAAEALVDWLAGDPTGSTDPDVLVIGDLNSYDEEDPIDALRAGSDDLLGTGDDFVDLEERFEGEFAYSYGFDGQFGYLDYALASTCLVPQVTGTTTWHINADEPDILDYDTSFKQAAQDDLFEANPYRSSDHDPVLVGLELYGTPRSILAQAVTEVERLRADGTLNGGQANALLKKLEQVQKSLDKDKGKTVLNQLGAFENQLDSLVAAGKISPAQAAGVTCLVQALRRALS